MTTREKYDNDMKRELGGLFFALFGVAIIVIIVCKSINITHSSSEETSIMQVTTTDSTKTKLIPTPNATIEKELDNLVVENDEVVVIKNTVKKCTVNGGNIYVLENGEIDFLELKRGYAYVQDGGIVSKSNVTGTLKVEAGGTADHILLQPSGALVSYKDSDCTNIKASRNSVLKFQMDNEKILCHYHVPTDMEIPNIPDSARSVTSFFTKLPVILYTSTNDMKKLLDPNSSEK